MGKAGAARKLASAAAYGGGGLSVLGAGLYGVLRAEAQLARRTIGDATDARPPDATGWYGRGRPGPAIKIVLLGDSSAAGYGVDRVEQTPGALLASGAAERADRRVYLRAFAKVGARSSDLEGQLDQALPIKPDVAVILIGVNDVTHRVRPAASVGALAEAVRRLKDADVAVVVGTCPDLGTVKPIPPPLKQVARTWSRRVAAAQTIAVIEGGGRTVSLGSVRGPELAAAPARYRSLAAVLMPSMLAALGLIPDDEAAPEALRGEGVLPITTAALQAVSIPGTELDGTEVAGRTRGVRGLWVELRHRRRLPQPEGEAPDDSEANSSAAASGDEPAAAQTNRGTG